MAKSGISIISGILVLGFFGRVDHMRFVFPRASFETFLGAVGRQSSHGIDERLVEESPNVSGACRCLLSLIWQLSTAKGLAGFFSRLSSRTRPDPKTAFTASGRVGRLIETGADERGCVVHRIIAFPVTRPPIHVFAGWEAARVLIFPNSLSRRDGFDVEEFAGCRRPFRPFMFFSPVR